MISVIEGLNGARIAPEIQVARAARATAPLRAVDLFAGLGGWTLGAELAGVPVLWAANHWRPTVDAHASNHPLTEHECQDLHQADWSLVPSHEIALTSPCCGGHARARGKERPHHDTSRSTAWAVVSCCEYHRPIACLTENVAEFQDWSLFPAWRHAMESLGYTLAIHTTDHADHGVPQNRIRIFIVATRSKAPLWLRLPRRPHVPFASIARWGEGEWSPIARMCANTRRRARNGRREFGDRFLIPYYGSEDGGRSIDRPLGTLTTRDRFALVDGDRMRMLLVEECRDAMGFPSTYRLPAKRKLAKHMIGNAVSPIVTRDIIAALKAAL